MKKWIRRIAISGLIIACVLCLFAYVLPVPITGYKAERRARTDYAEHKGTFAKIVNETNLQGSLLGRLFGVDKIQIPSELESIGIGKAFVASKMLFLEYDDPIMGTTSFGIVYTEDVNSLEEWYRIKPIEDDWYFYRVVS